MGLFRDRSAPPEEHPAQPPRADRTQMDVDGLTAVLDRLVERGVLTRMQAVAVVQECGGPADPARPEGLRRRLAEIAAYLGASFVVGATLLFLGQEWDALGRGGRFSILAAMAAILFGSGVAVRSSAAMSGDRWWRSWAGDSMRRRLSSTLLTGAATAAGFAAYVGLARDTHDYTTLGSAPFVASVAGLAVVVAGYLLARSALGQLGAAVAALAAYGGLLELLEVNEPTVFHVGMLALGAVWAVLAWHRLVAERRFALGISVTFGLLSAQLVVLDRSESGDLIGYALMVLVAGVCFAAYARIREWVVLAGGVVGATLVVPQFLYDVTDGSLGASGVLLVAGVTLLVGSVTGLRIRRTPDPDPGPRSELTPAGS